MKHAKTQQHSLLGSRSLRLFVGLALVLGLMPSASFAEQETVAVRGSEGEIEQVVVEQPSPSADNIETADEGETAPVLAASASEPETEQVDGAAPVAFTEDELPEEAALVALEGETAENNAAIEISLASAPKAESGVDYYNDPVSISVKVTDDDFASGTVKAMRNGSAVKTESISSTASPTILSLAPSDTEDGAVTIEVETKDAAGATKTYSYGPDSGTCATKANGSAVSNTKIAVNAAPQVSIEWSAKGVGSVHGTKAIFPSTAKAESSGVVATITVTDKTLFGSPADNTDAVTITAAGATLGDWSGTNGVYTREATFAFEDGKTVSVNVSASDAGALSESSDSSITMEADGVNPKLTVESYAGSDESQKARLFNGKTTSALTTDDVTVVVTIEEDNPLNEENIVVDFGDGEKATDLSKLTPTDGKYVLSHTYSVEGLYAVTVTGNNSMDGACDAAGNPLTESGASSGKYRAIVAVDKSAPVVSVGYYTGYVSQENKGFKVVADEDDGAYVAGEKITAEITVVDVNFDEAKTDITLADGGAVKQQGGKTWKVAEDGITHVALVEYDVRINASREFSLSLVAKDALDQETVYPNSGEDVIVVDKASPKLTVEFSDDAKSNEIEGGKEVARYYDGSKEITAIVTVEDNRIKRSKPYINVEVNGRQGTWENVDSNTIKMTLSFQQPKDGAETTYELSITGRDYHGNKIISANPESTYVDNGSYATKVVLDSKPPELSVEWDNNDAVNGHYYNAGRTATVKVDDTSFDASLIKIDGEATAAGDWTVNGTTRTYTTKEYSGDDTHRLTVEGTDRLGQSLVGKEATDTDPGTKVDAQGKYDSGEFVIDTVAPKVTLAMSQLPSKQNETTKTDYYRSGNQLTATVSVDDKNFNPAKEEFVSADGKPYGTIVEATGTFEKAYQKERWSNDGSYEVVFTPNDAVGAAPSNTLSATVYDLAGNSTTIAYGDKSVLSEDNEVVSKVVNAQNVEISGNPNFTLDVTSPVIVPGNGSDVPNRVYSGNYSDTLVFYKDATTLRIVVNDAIGIEGITGEGGNYTFDTVSGESGDKSWTMDVNLKNGVEFTDDFLLTATDLAQNVRKWKISPKTLEVQDAANSSATNLPLYDDEPELYPVALILDTTAPTISVSGAMPGTYYNSTQPITTAIEELNFKYLKQYDGSQVITTVTKKAGNATRAASTETIPAASFTGGGSAYSSIYQAADDGHYSIAAHITDPAGNEASASLGEFTIDKTAPVASISWDNTDVRNDKYYAAARTATITIVEHNFNANRISITTTGSVGAWIDNGDTHTIQVSFSTDGTYNLSVTGTDLAGNAMNELTEPEFVVDMTVPNIEFSVVEDGHAYGKGIAVAPVITFTDEANFDPNGTSYTLTGSKNGAVSYAAGTSDADNSRTVTYNDFGAERGDSYDPNADDIYTLHATMTDMAGNAAAEKSITFSVNRYGSTYRVLEGDYTKENVYLDEAPEVRIQEINVSGTYPERNSIVLSPEGASQKYLTMNASAASTGYTVTESTSTEGASRGWATYTYSIAPGNFDHDARYHVVVTSEDRAANRNTSTGYYNRDKSEPDAKAEVVFILDENAPEVVGLHVTGSELDEYYEGEFSVHEDIGIADVAVTLDGEALEVEDLGGNNYSFRAPSRSFAPSRELVVTATDLSDKTGTGEVDLTSLLIAIPVGVVVAVAAVVAAVFAVRRRNAGRHAS